MYNNLSTQLLYHETSWRSFKGRPVLEQNLSAECSEAQSCLTLCYPKDCNLPGTSVLSIFQVRILEQAATSSPSGSFWPRDESFDCTGGFITTESPGEPRSKICQPWNLSLRQTDYFNLKTIKAWKTQEEPLIFPYCLKTFRQRTCSWNGAITVDSYSMIW